MKDFFREIKWFFQRGRRGWADSDAWDTHSYLSRMLPEMVRKMKEGYGCPSDLYDDSKVNDESHKWHEVLEEIAQGFEAAQFLDSSGYHKWVESGKGFTLEIDTEAMENARKKLDRGLELFKQYYLNLWD